MTESTEGRFGWYELMTTDPGAAEAFYSDVVGWGTEAWDGAPTPYTMWMNGKAPVGGLMELPPEAAAAGAPPHWLAYISTPSLDHTVERAKELGGTVVWGPMDIPGTGRVVGLSDPDGAQFALHQALEEAGGSSPAPPGPRDFSWHELATTDPAGAFAFYGQLFGWKAKDEHDLGEMGVYHEFQGGGVPLGGIYLRPPEVPVSHWLLYVTVGDLDASVGRVRALGGQVLNGPMDVPGGDRVAQCLDPQGAAFGLHEPASG